jgi:hypothetical protein
VFGVTLIFLPPSVKSQANSLQGKNGLSIARIPDFGPGTSDSAFGETTGAVTAVKLDRKLVIAC